MNKVFEALAHPDRRKIVSLLKRDGEMTAGEIAERFDVTKPTMSHHLKLMTEAGLLEREKRGQYVHYRLNLSVFSEVLQLMLELFSTESKKGESAQKDDGQDAESDPSEDAVDGSKSSKKPDPSAVSLKSRTQKGAKR